EQADHALRVGGDHRHLGGRIEHRLQVALRGAGALLLVVQPIEQLAQALPQRMRLFAAQIQRRLALALVDHRLPGPAPAAPAPGWPFSAAFTSGTWLMFSCQDASCCCGWAITRPLPSSTMTMASRSRSCCASSRATLASDMSATSRRSPIGKASTAVTEPVS